MTGRPFSPQTVLLLAALAASPNEKRHGYDLARETGLKSGTLYPILIRLAERDLVEASWETEQPAGRPRRHLYQLTSAGLAAAQDALAARPARQVRPAAAKRAASGQRRVVPEGST